MSGGPQPGRQVRNISRSCCLWEEATCPILTPFALFSWENKDVYARAVRSLRLRELQNPECMTAVRAGLSSIIPLQLLTMLTPLEMELRTCGLPHINLEFLKVIPAPLFSV